MNEDSILELVPQKTDRVKAAEFAAKTLAWTFNRMAYNLSVLGQKYRTLNIVKGILAQEMLSQELRMNGIKVITDNSYRISDNFDFLIKLNGKEIKLDLKTNNHYSNYNIKGRDPFSKKLLVKYADYPGPDWRYFFPMLMPHNQIGQDKDAYCFGITSSIDFRNDLFTDRDGSYLCAFPYGEWLSFYSNKIICRAREENNAGFFLNIKYNDNCLFPVKKLKFEIIGEWMEKYKFITVELPHNKIGIRVGPFSIISSFRVFQEQWEDFNGEIKLSIAENQLKVPVLNFKKFNINVPPSELSLTKANFCNLILPENYHMYLMGWIFKEDFLKACRKYSSMVWPIDKINKFENQPWSQITESDKKSISKLGFEDCISKKPTKFNAGWLKTNGHGGGACCYVFPNIGRNGGVMETNLYVLPSDLNEMSSLINSKKK